jgi:hypothetical protein
MTILDGIVLALLALGAAYCFASAWADATRMRRARRRATRRPGR